MKYLISNINNYDESFLINFYLSIPVSKKEKIEKIKNKENRLSSIVGEYLLSLLLKEININYNNILYTYNKNGKPYLKDQPIFFNISHSHGYVVCMISNYECGADIEKIRKIDLNVLKIFANDKEKKYILKNDNNKLKRLFEVYTFKEAYLKMLGDKLSIIQNINLESINNINKKVIINKDYVITLIEKN